MLTNVVHCRYNLLLKVIMAILYTFSCTIIREQWAFLQKCEFNNPKALLIYPSKLMQRIIQKLTFPLLFDSCPSTVTAETYRVKTQNAAASCIFSACRSVLDFQN